MDESHEPQFGHHDNSAITIGRNIATGTSNLTLDGGTLAFTGARILSGENITFTGNATNAGALTVNANGQLTLK